LYSIAPVAAEFHYLNLHLYTYRIPDKMAASQTLNQLSAPKKKRNISWAVRLSWLENAEY